jgi:hypothetical protein
VAVDTYNPSNLGGIHRRISPVKGSGKTVPKTKLKNNKKDLGQGSNGRTLAKDVKDPGFNAKIN